MFNSRLDRLERKVSYLDSRLDRLERKVSYLDSKVARLNCSHENIKYDRYFHSELKEYRYSKSCPDCYKVWFEDISEEEYAAEIMVKLGNQYKEIEKIRTRLNSKATE